MKTVFFSILLLGVLTINSCSKNDDNGDKPGENSEYLTAKVNGSNYTGGSEHGDFISATISSGVLVFQGTNNSGSGINFTIVNYTGEGSYKTGDHIENMNLIQYVEVSPMGAWSSNGVLTELGLEPGEINVTKQTNNHVEGTFKFVGFNPQDESTKSITEGKFRANLEN